MKVLLQEVVGSQEELGPSVHLVSEGHQGRQLQSAVLVPLLLQ